MAEAREIRPGDVLLFHGSSFVSWAIRKFDGTDVNHAAIALDSAVLGEAGGGGLQRTPIDLAVASNEYMRVRRHSDQDLAPVVTVANTYLDGRHPYAYQQIVLLALLATTRKIKLTGLAKRMIRSVLDHAAAALNGFLDQGGKRSMICSEFVYRAYREPVADPTDRYRILVQVGGAAFADADLSVVEWALRQPDDLIAAAANQPVSFSGTAMSEPGLTDEAAEPELAPLIAAWAEESGAVDDDMPPPPPPSFTPQFVEEPSDEELLGSVVAFSSAFADSTSEGTPSFGFELGAGGVAAVRGAIEGVLNPDIESNFVTPGDLLLSPTLTDVYTVRRGG